MSKCKPTVSVIKSDFNARSLSWWSEDINTSEGTKLYSPTSSNGFSQLIKEPTHIQTNSSSCIDLVFMYQRNLSVNSGVHESLHQIVIIKLYILNLILLFPTPHHTSVSCGITKRQIQKKIEKP